VCNRVMTRQVVDRLLADRTLAFRRLSAICTASSGSKMSCRSPRNVIVANREPAPFGPRYESLPIDLSTDPRTTP
jgi:hypothetical protein